MRRVIVLDEARIEGGRLRHVAAAAPAPRVGDAVRVELDDRRSLRGEVTRVYYLDGLRYDVRLEERTNG